MNKKSFFLYFYLNILFEVLDITNSIRYKLSETAKILKKKKMAGHHFLSCLEVHR